MSDDINYPELPHPRHAARAMQVFKHRVARLNRLIELEAPVIILIHETQLVAKAGEQLSPHYWHEAIKHDAQISARRRLGICAVPSCDEDVKGGYEGPFDNDHCAKHAAETEKEMTEEDEEEDDDLD